MSVKILRVTNSVEFLYAMGYSRSTRPVSFHDSRISSSPDPESDSYHRPML